jgi:predicted N-acyltransferase
VFAARPSSLELVIAERQGRLVAGAFNVAAGDRLFGRYWGCFEEHPFLHFTVCYYHSIDECIARRVRVFEGGAGGEHKIARGFEPAATYSAHAFSHRGLHEALQRHIQNEAQSRAAALTSWQADSHILKPIKNVPESL